MCGVVEEFNARNEEERIIIICINPEGGCGGGRLWCAMPAFVSPAIQLKDVRGE